MKVVVNPKNNLTATVQGKNSVLVNQSGQVRRIADLIDVDLMGLEDGSLLIYNATSEKFEASILLEKQNINGGHF
jgi:hypothetical protein